MIVRCPSAVYVTDDGEKVLSMPALRVLLRVLSHSSAENLGEQLHHADWILTSDPAEIEARGLQLHDCPACHAGVQRAHAALREDPTMEILVGLLYWAEPKEPPA